MRPCLFLAAILAAPVVHAAPAISAADLQHARSLGASYRQCLQDTLGEHYLGSEAAAPVQLAGDVEHSCETQLLPVQRYLSTRGYDDTAIRDAVVDIKARADGAAIAYVHRLPAYRY